MNYSCLSGVGIVLILGLTGCYKVGHKDFLGYRDNEIGTIMHYKKPFKFDNSGEFKRGDYVITGQGLTSITKDNNGDLIYHFSGQEILSHFHTKEWVGKCLTYKIVDPQTYIIKGWGFDEGANPLSCRSWP